MPVFVLYNPARADLDYSDSPCVRRLDPGADWFTAVSAMTARNLLTTGSSARKVLLNRVRRYAHPWSCLALCPDDPYRGWLRREFPWPPDPTDGLPPAFWDDSVPGAAARLATLSLVDAARVEDVGMGPEAATQLVQLFVAASFTEAEPLWVRNPADALGMWHQAKGTIDTQGPDSGDEVGDPVAVVVQEF